MEKRKRARALRRMDREEAQTYSLGGMVDESIPEQAVDNVLEEYRLPVEVRDDFAAYLRQRVGYYRSRTGEEAPTTARELELVDEAMEVLAELRTRLTNLPPQADGHINYIAWKRHGEFFHAYQQRLDADLRETWNMLSLTERELDETKGKSRGRKPESERDSFLSDVAGWLTEKGGLPEPRAFKATYSLCIALRVNVPEYADPDNPDDPGQLGSIIRAWRERHSAGETNRG